MWFLRTFLLLLITSCGSFGQNAQTTIVFRHKSTQIPKEFQTSLNNFLAGYANDTSYVFVVRFPDDACGNPYQYTFKQTLTVAKTLQQTGVKQENIIALMKAGYAYDTFQIIRQVKDSNWYEARRNIIPPPLLRR
jgi:hypothetical protein